MREYELTVVYDLAVAEQGGPDASVKLLSAAIEARGGKVNKIDHWGRRRLAYPIGRAIDGDYIITRVDLEPTAISPLEEAFRIDERIYRHLVVRADELPAPPVPREPRRMPNAPEAAAPAAPVAAAPAAPVEASAEAPAAPEAAAATAAPDAVAEATAPEPEIEAPAETEPTA
jgi:small subunit ribosomal protein S6